MKDIVSRAADPGRARTPMESPSRRCPGCRLEMPLSAKTYDGYFHASPECWSVFGEVLAAEFQNAILFGQVHQLTVDTYAVQHAGGPHPDKSVCVHLTGLHLVYERGVAPVQVAPIHQRLASGVTSWPHFDPPENRGPLTVFDAAMAAGSVQEHISIVRRWSAQVWKAWEPHHAAVAALVSSHLGAQRIDPETHRAF